MLPNQDCKVPLLPIEQRAERTFPQPVQKSLAAALAGTAKRLVIFGKPSVVRRRRNHQRWNTLPIQITARSQKSSLRTCTSQPGMRRMESPAGNGPEYGSAWGPVILPVFKTGAWHLRGVMGAFDSHTLPPNFKRLAGAAISSATSFRQLMGQQVRTNPHNRQGLVP